MNPAGAPAGAPRTPVEAAELLASRLPPRRLAEVVATMSRSYRSEGAAPRAGPEEVAAYCAYRFPATYAAARSALGALAGACPGLAPSSLLDLGGGAGAAAFAAAGSFPSIESVTVLDANADMLRAGEEIAALVPGVLPPAAWTRADLPARAAALPPADLVVISYLLGELPPAARDELIVDVAASPAPAAVLVVEPGTSTGHANVLAARAALVRAGWTVAAPCPHDEACPMRPPDWCHFSVRIPRSHLHRLVKGGALGWEDEKFSYVAAVRDPAARPEARIVRHPEWRRSVAVLQLCVVPPAIRALAVPRSAGARYRAVRHARWGDAWPPPEPPEPPAPPAAAGPAEP